MAPGTLNSILSTTFSGGGGGGGFPTGPARGDLTGLYLNPTLVGFGSGAAIYRNLTDCYMGVKTFNLSLSAI